MASKTLSEARARIVLAHLEEAIVFHTKTLEMLERAKASTEKIITKERAKAEKKPVAAESGHAGHRR